MNETNSVVPRAVERLTDKISRPFPKGILIHCGGRKRLSGVRGGELGKDIEGKNHSWHTTASKLTGLEGFLGVLASFKPCTATLVWKPQREGNHRLAKQLAVVFSSGFILETWNHRTLWADWREKANPLEAPGGREDTCAAAAKPHGLHCPQLWGKPTREASSQGSRTARLLY